MIRQETPEDQKLFNEGNKTLSSKTSTKLGKTKHNRPTSGELLSNDRRAFGFVSS